MKFGAEKYISAIVLAAFCAVLPAYAQQGLSPQDFNRMYWFASRGDVSVLREAVDRGLNINSVNPNGDTGLCIAIKRRNYAAYNSFRLAGANPRHPCTMRIQREYRSFIEDNKSIHAEKVLSNSSSLYYSEAERSWWPWILGGALVGGGVFALTNHSGGSSGSGANNSDSDSEHEIIDPENHGYGLGGYMTNYSRLVNSGAVTNSANIDGTNPNAASVVDNVNFLPSMINNYKYLNTYVKVTDGASFHNVAGGKIMLGDAALGMTAYGDGTRVSNDGIIDVEARNGAIGMVASNGASAVNGADSGSSLDIDDGSIRFIFKGKQEGDTVIGMYGDTHASLFNYGKINGTTAATSASSASVVPMSTVASANSGTMLGMALFNLYSGQDYSGSIINAQNSGNITLLAGNNNATSAAISLIGMGSYLDDKFLDGKNNPAFAEQIILQNLGDINLAYQKTYNINSEALKLGDGGVIGIRADASTGALNRGTIKIDMQATTIATNNDVAAGMLSVHGASLVNGTPGSSYRGGTSNTGGTIQIINEATSGGVFYGMLAAKGSGAQTSLYKWKTPYLYNYGLIDMQVSHAFGMASFAGGNVINDGTINLGVENGQSYYTNNIGMYAEGSSVTEQASLVNNGVINVYSVQSSAIYNAFSGSVTQTNTGRIYISNKASNSKVFGGNYSKASNVGEIEYKAGNSDNFSPPAGKASDIGFNVKVSPTASVINASSESSGSSTNKQYVVNEESGVITIGGEFDSDTDYGGTFGVAGIQVSKQGSADNKGNMYLVSYDPDWLQFNTAMWLDSSTTNEAYGHNYGVIAVAANNSIGMRNDSAGNASMSNFGVINVFGRYSYGMSTTQVGASIYNGRANDVEGENKTINVNGYGSIAMYIKNGNAINYGTINLNNDATTAFQLDGADATVWTIDDGIVQLDNLRDITHFWMTNGATRTFEHEIFEDPDAENEDERYWTTPFDIEGYTLGKATTDSSGGSAYFSKNSVGYVSGSKSHLFVAIGSGSRVYNQGKVEVSGGATAMTAEKGGEAYNDLRYAELTVKDADSTGIYGVNSGTKVGTTIASNLNVEAGKGIFAEELAAVSNNGNINVTGGVGIHLRDGNATQHTTGTSAGNITVNGTYEGVGNIGVQVNDGAQFTNSGAMSVSYPSASGEIAITGMPKAISSNAEVTNTGTITVTSNTIGVYTTGGSVSNSGNGAIYVSGINAYGIYGAGGEIKNSGLIRVSGGTGVYGTLENTKGLEVNGGIGVRGKLVNKSSGVDGFEVNGGTGVVGTLDNQGAMRVFAGVGLDGSGQNSGAIYVNGGLGLNVTGSFDNSGTISGVGTLVNVDGGTFTNNDAVYLTNGTAAIQIDNDGSATNLATITVSSGRGMYVINGNATSTGDITVTNGTGMYADDGSILNSGDITVNSGTGMHVNKGTATNNGTITIGSGKGMYVGSAATGSNSGVITLSNNGYGAFVEDGGTFNNSGTIYYNSKNYGACTNRGADGTCEDLGADSGDSGGSGGGDTPEPTSVMSSLVYFAGDSSTFINSGTVDLGEEDVDFGDGGNYVLSSGGKYKAAHFSGNITASSDIVTEGFSDVYVEEGAFEGINNGLEVVSNSYMFDAEVQDNGGQSDVVLTRKSFNDLVAERDLAAFFESDYKAQNGENMYRSLKSAASPQAFNAVAESEAGKKFYANIDRENMAVLRGMQNDAQRRVLEDGLSGGVAGASWFRTGKDGVDGLSDYKDDVYSLYAGFGKRVGRDWSIGATLTAAYADASYDDVHSERDNKIIMAFLPIMYQNSRFKFLSTPSVGAGFGEYKRRSLANAYDADTFDIYYGLYNHAEYSIDVKIAELVTEAELNLQGASSEDAKEKDGLKLKAHDMLSLEAGIGLKLRKRIYLARERELMFALGAKYYRELLNPYKDLTIGREGLAQTYLIKGYDEDKNRVKTTAEASYRDGPFVLSAEVAHNFEKENNVEGGVNMRYKF